MGPPHLMKEIGLPPKKKREVQLLCQLIGEINQGNKMIMKIRMISRPKRKAKEEKTPQLKGNAKEDSGSKIQQKGKGQG